MIHNVFFVFFTMLIRLYPSGLACWQTALWTVIKRVPVKSSHCCHWLSHRPLPPHALMKVRHEDPLKNMGHNCTAACYICVASMSHCTHCEGTHCHSAAYKIRRVLRIWQLIILQMAQGYRKEALEEHFLYLMLYCKGNEAQPLQKNTCSQHWYLAVETSTWSSVLRSPQWETASPRSAEHEQWQRAGLWHGEWEWGWSCVSGGWRLCVWHQNTTLPRFISHTSLTPLALKSFMIFFYLKA